MRVLVCGSRHFKDWSLLYATLDRLNSETPISCVIHGCARGADTLAEEWAYSRRNKSIGDALGVERFPADWNKYGKGAGPIRNKQMLDEGKPDKVIAFRGPNSRGTQNMINQAEKAGIPVTVIEIE